VPCPDYPHEAEHRTVVYVRPHELDIGHDAESPACLAATVLHVHPAGAVARVHLLAQDGDVLGDVALHAELSPERFEKLDLKCGDRVFVAPRRARVFVPDYAI
jgi:sulfate transport system ATP-binding protein